MKLIAIYGGKRSGKDTVADYIVSNYNGTKFQLGSSIKTILSRAWRSEEVGISLRLMDFNGIGIDREKALPISNKHVGDYLMRCVEIAKKDFGFSPGRTEQVFGTYYFNEVCIDEIEHHINNIVLNNNEAWTIRRFMQTLGTDICVHFDKNVWVRYFAGRYVEAIESGQFDYFVVPDVRQIHETKVVRGLGAKCLHIEKGIVSTDTHITEQKLPIENGDTIITNTGTLDELYAQIKTILKA
ncbi:deoxynucleoside monophosphate kinase [Serratia phage 92A1]|nr:deoxynucleoside monophosphate kinase [Serratia phage 92A1]